ncbi:MAG TPA: S8 family serine peptidase [Steroidobacteraceae bacterium]|nr:S8 family serine peptidase [Steroidobacteraceae bacterium]
MGGLRTRRVGLSFAFVAMGLVLLAFSVGCVARGPSTADASSLAAGSAAHPERQIVVTIRDSRANLRAAPGSTARAYSSPSSYQASAYARRVIAALEHDYALEWVAGWRIDLLNVHCVVFMAHDAAARDELLAKLRKDSRVESAQPMNVFATTSRAADYNDPYFSLQKGVEEIHVPEAQRWSKGRGVTIAVIDTGVATAHPELAGRIKLTRNFVDDDMERFQLDRHGTAVAGVIAALTNNGEGIVGVAPASDLIALKACWQERLDAAAVCNTLTLAEALAFAIERRARIINLSLTGPSDPLLTRLVGRAVEQGILVLGASVAHTGAAKVANGGSFDAGFPLSVPGVIAVADADSAGASPLKSVASVAPAAPRAARPLLAAPGQEVLTLAPGGRYDYVSGASISTAMVTGVVALLLERGQHLQAGEVRALLERTGYTGTDESLRIVDACDAVASVVRAQGCREIRTAAEIIPK